MDEGAYGADEISFDVDIGASEVDNSDVGEAAPEVKEGASDAEESASEVEEDASDV